MRTTDFSKAPQIGRAEVMVVSPTRLPGVGAAAGCLAHRTTWMPPLRLGTIAWFAREVDLTGYLRSLPPAKAPDRSTPRIYRASPHGYSNGVWRAEGDVLAHIEHFTALPGEADPPPVVRTRRTRSAGRESA